MRTAIFFVIIVGASAIPPSGATAQGLGFPNEDAMGRLQGWYVGIEIHASFLSDIRGMSNVLPTFGYGVRVGHRWDDMAGFVQIEQNLWRQTESAGRNLSLGALNIALGFDGIYAGGKVHTSVAAGASILLDSTPLDEAGNVGLFFELRPIGLRWRAEDNIGFNIDPVTLAIVAPVLTGIPLIHIQYRTTLGMEILP
jgi:hypothetical protein